MGLISTLHPVQRWLLRHYCVRGCTRAPHPRCKQPWEIESPSNWGGVGQQAHGRAGSGAVSPGWAKGRGPRGPGRAGVVRGLCTPRLCRLRGPKYHLPPTCPVPQFSTQPGAPPLLSLLGWGMAPGSSC